MNEGKNEWHRSNDFYFIWHDGYENQTCLLCKSTYLHCVLCLRMCVCLKKLFLSLDHRHFLSYLFAILLLYFSLLLFIPFIPHLSLQSPLCCQCLWVLFTFCSIPPPLNPCPCQNSQDLSLFCLFVQFAN